MRTPEQVYERYLELTQRALGKVRIAAPEKTPLGRSAADYLDMARRYVADARHFRKEGKVAEALAAVAYAHGWLDAGARLGLFDVQGDSALFTVD